MDHPSSAVPAVTHNVAAHRFEVTVDGHLSVADYELREGAIIFTHTYVPDALRGRGLAAKLVQPALEYARREKLRVVPSCSYVATYLERHPEFKALVG